MAKKKGTYHFGYENTDKKGAKKIVAACDDSKQPDDLLLRLPMDHKEFDRIIKLAEKKQICPVCDRLFRSYLTGREHGFTFGIQKILEKLGIAKASGAAPSIHDHSPSGMAH